MAGEAKEGHEMTITPRVLRAMEYIVAVRSAHLLWLRRPVHFMGLALFIYISQSLAERDHRYMFALPVLLVGVLFLGCSVCWRVDTGRRITLPGVISDLNKSRELMLWAVIPLMLLTAVVVLFGTHRNPVFVIMAILGVGAIFSLFDRAMLSIKYDIKGIHGLKAMMQATQINSPMLVASEGVALLFALYPIAVTGWVISPYIALIYVSWSYFINKALFEERGEMGWKDTSSESL